MLSESEIVAIDESSSVEQLPIEPVQVIDDESMDREPVQSTSVDQLMAIEDLGRRIDALGDGVQALAAGNTDDDEVATADVVVMELSDGQWQEIRESWGWCKAGFSVALFLALVCTLLVAAIFGNRLWSAFSKGWRR